MKLALNKESAEALRNFADAMPWAIAELASSTEKLMGVYQSVEGDVGEHRQDFLDMLTLIKRATLASQDAIQELPGMMRHTADMIDDYVDKHSSVGGN